MVLGIKTFMDTDLLFISVTAKLVLVIDGLAVVHISVLRHLQSLKEAVPSLYGAANIRGRGHNILFISEEVGQALSPSLSHFQSLKVS